MFGVWEPLLEPLEVEKTDLFKPWVLEIKVYFPNWNSNLPFHYLSKNKYSASFIAEANLTILFLLVGYQDFFSQLVSENCFCTSEDPDSQMC